ncbi:MULTISPECIES: GntR family transcriptional regulator [unclassified Cryobacterium]|uniref:GntR family transcriptional regulator n=1 Tax=unclassified Cryobacterium TaxID=2649013 RepID=UPI002AB3785F|nr:MULTISPECIES: GntR family transcriptional regulator [unclassified Cryobacterium]MDY7529233.1 GntR family transcriptional regulator [Cryobacterium sp. 10C2]MDY7558607.1 GntR family transcriptional regulator [Cryobacterium sp. 10C3]MEB0289711.1 GntR family transcriptional regulator [Cryobacterium sp. 10C2]MEB0304497.1 GntR family transcriptional regulator [Cryobacterium sp. 10I1]
MILRIDAASPTPPFEQLRLQILTMINTGALVPGTRLPTVRALAADLRLAPNTVARAYKELEEAELLQTRGRAGTFVKAGTDTAAHHAVKAARDYADLMRKLGVTGQEAISYINAAVQNSGLSETIDSRPIPIGDEATPEI